MVKAGAMALKAVVPRVPRVPRKVKERELLEEDLRRIGCHGFSKKPWNFKIERMVVELMGEKDNRWRGTPRQAPKK